MLMGKHLGMGPLEKLRRWWKNNIKMNFREMGCEGGKLMRIG
jgi:hypothetical protein